MCDSVRAYCTAWKGSSSPDPTICIQTIGSRELLDTFCSSLPGEVDTDLRLTQTCTVPSS
eukprot:3327075-Amphidinium_carterae.1